MRIKPDEDVAGFPARKIRELLRQSVDFLSARHATKILEIEREQAIQLLERLEQGGLLERNPALPNSDDGVLNTTKSRVIYESPEQNPAVPMDSVPKQRAHGPTINAK